MNFDDVLKMVNIMVDKNESKSLQTTIDRLERKIEQLTEQKETKKSGKDGDAAHLDPIEIAERQADVFTKWRKVFLDMGILVDAKDSKPASGQSIEVTKENNRHAEEMERLKIDKNYKDNMVNVAADITENLGRGAAHEVLSSMRSGGKAETKTKGALLSKKCEEQGCGTMIYFPPEATKIKCPKCAMVYERDVVPI